MSYFVRVNRARLLTGTEFVAARELVNPGRITVAKGEQVTSGQVVGVCEMPGDEQTFKLETILGVAPERIAKYLTKKPGDTIKAGEAVAIRRTLAAKRVFRSPIEGKLKRIHKQSGAIVLERPPVEYMLEAGYEGEVVEVEEGKGIRIRTIVDMVRCVFGRVTPSIGAVEILTEENEPLRERHIDGGCCDRILISGGNITYNVLKRAKAMGVKGIVAASIPAVDWQRYIDESGDDLSTDLSLSILLTEGFGDFAMRLEFWEFFELLRGEMVMLSTLADSAVPAVIVPIGENGEKNTLMKKASKKGLVKLKKKQNVRIISGANFGNLGVIASASIQDGNELLSEEIETIKVRVGEDELLVPRWNLETVV